MKPCHPAGFFALCLLRKFLRYCKLSLTYPVNNEKNQSLYKKYRELAVQDTQVLFGGRLAEYVYYDMDKVVFSALRAVEREFK